MLLNLDFFSKLQQINVIESIFLLLSFRDIIHIRLTCKLFNYMFKIWSNSNIIKLKIHIDDDTLQIFSGYKNIDLSYSGISDIGLKHFKEVTNINLSNCYDITDEGLKILFNLNDKLIIHTIDLSSCFRITDEGFKYLQGVKHIFLRNSMITDEGLKYLAGNNPSIHTIDLYYCDNITDKGISYLVDLSTNTYPHTIILSHCEQITNEGLKYIYLKGAYKIDLFNNNITTKGLKYLNNSTIII